MIRFLKESTNEKIYPSPSHLNNRVPILALLPPRLTPLIAPRKVHHWHQKERVRAIQQTRHHIIPRDERRDDTEHTSSARQRHVRRAVGRVARVEVADAEADESDPDAEEERVEGEGRAEGQDPHHEGEDEPAEDLGVDGQRLTVSGMLGLLAYVEGESGIVVWSLSAVCFSDSEAAGDFEDREAHPKAAVRSEGAASEGVAWDRVSQVFKTAEGRRRRSLEYVPTAISHMPASSWMKPPYASAGAMTMVDWLRFLVPRLTKLSKNVVNANPASPRGTGFAICVFGGL